MSRDDVGHGELQPASQRALAYTRSQLLSLHTAAPPPGPGVLQRILSLGLKAVCRLRRGCVRSYRGRRAGRLRRLLPLLRRLDKARPSSSETVHQHQQPLPSSTVVDSCPRRPTFLDRRPRWTTWRRRQLSWPTDAFRWRHRRRSIRSPSAPVDGSAHQGASCLLHVSSTTMESARHLGVQDRSSVVSVVSS